jgi:hypothetical protein
VVFGILTRMLPIGMVAVCGRFTCAAPAFNSTYGANIGYLEGVCEFQADTQKAWNISGGR